MRNLPSFFLAFIILFCGINPQLSASFNKFKLKFNDSIPTVQKETPYKIVEKLVFDTVITFDPKAYTEIVKVVKVVLRDTITMHDKEDAMDHNVFQTIEGIPRFPGCEEIGGSEQEKKICATDKLSQYVKKELKYPSEGFKNRAEGVVVVQFMVKKDGNISAIEVIRGLGSGDESVDELFKTEAIRVINKMNSFDQGWTPAKLRGQNIDAPYTLPIHFRMPRRK